LWLRPINPKVPCCGSICRRVHRLHSFLQRGSPAAKTKRKEVLSLSRGQSSGRQARACPGEPAARVTDRPWADSRQILAVARVPPIGRARFLLMSVTAEDVETALAGSRLSVGLGTPTSSEPCTTRA
jgi:hypothetical protein